MTDCGVRSCGRGLRAPPSPRSTAAGAARIGSRYVGPRTTRSKSLLGQGEAQLREEAVGPKSPGGGKLRPVQAPGEPWGRELRRGTFTMCWGGFSVFTLGFSLYFAGFCTRGRREACVSCAAATVLFHLQCGEQGSRAALWKPKEKIRTALAKIKRSGALASWERPGQEIHFAREFQGTISASAGRRFRRAGSVRSWRTANAALPLRRTEGAN
jgi:hypothetical protein